MLDCKHPDDAALRHVIAETDIALCQRVLDTLRVDAPAGLNGDVFGAVDLISNRCTGDARVGLLLPDHVSSLGVESAEHPVVGAADKDQVAAGGQHGGEELPREVVLPHLLAGGGIPRL